MTASDQVKAPAYTVKRIETVVKGSDVQARVFTLAPGETIPWHFHRESTDHCFVLEGILSISTHEPEVVAGKRRHATILT
jgi:quercetin dioxygenase-like cupin family protein